MPARDRSRRGRPARPAARHRLQALTAPRCGTRRVVGPPSVVTSFPPAPFVHPVIRFWLLAWDQTRRPVRRSYLVNRPPPRRSLTGDTSGGEMNFGLSCPQTNCGFSPVWPRLPTLCRFGPQRFQGSLRIGRDRGSLGDQSMGGLARSPRRVRRSSSKATTSGLSFSASIEGLAVGNAPASFVRGCDVAPVNRE